MELIVKPVGTDLFYQTFFEEPMLDETLEGPRIRLIKKLVKAFELRVNDIKFNVETPSNNYIRFSKFYDQSFFDVSFGLEEVSALLRMPTNETQVEGLYGKLFKIFEGNPISRQKISIQRQLSTEEDVALFLQSLNPYTPKTFQQILHGRGVIYDLKISEHELAIHVVVANSLYIKQGLFLSIEYDFSPNRYDFESAFKIAKDKHDFILKELSLRIETEA